MPRKQKILPNEGSQRMQSACNQTVFDNDKVSNQKYIYCVLKDTWAKQKRKAKGNEQKNLFIYSRKGSKDSWLFNCNLQGCIKREELETSTFLISSFGFDVSICSTSFVFASLVNTHYSNSTTLQLKVEQAGNRDQLSSRGFYEIKGMLQDFESWKGGGTGTMNSQIN